MVKPGDVFTIKTAKGMAYFQYILKNKLMGNLIRVLPGTYQNEPSSIDTLIDCESIIWTFFPVGSALARKEIRKIDNYKIPDHSKEMPLFRCHPLDFGKGPLMDWWLWDGEQEWPVKELTPDMHKLPLREIWDDVVLAERIATGWRSEHQV